MGRWRRTQAMLLIRMSSPPKSTAGRKIAYESPDSLEYFRGKAVLERELTESALSYAILRPAVRFVGRDRLVSSANSETVGLRMRSYARPCSSEGRTS